MKQKVFKSGQPICIETPSPQVFPRQLQVEVVASCISLGTELTASGKTLFRKARENPEKVKAAVHHMKTDGICSVLHSARGKTEAEGFSGYSAAGVVRYLKSKVIGFSDGMRVAIAGAGFANHAEHASVPVNLAVPIPDTVSFEEASTCALGCDALQGIRRSDISIGESVAVRCLWNHWKRPFEGTAGQKCSTLTKGASTLEVTSSGY